MSEEIARSLIMLAASMDPIFHKMIAEIENISDEAVKMPLRKVVGDALRDITVGVILSIEKRFPLLNPELR